MRMTFGVVLAIVATSSCFISARGVDWPMYRADAARTGHTAEPLPASLELQWVHRATQAPRPAWPSSNRIEFDLAFQPIVIDGLVVYGSSADDRVYALDLRSGQLRWDFFTEGPVRFAPAGWRGRVFVASDDGRLYALRLADGKLLWSHRGAPDDRKCMGNDRLISRWPARGGPVVVDRVVYYSAGIWPSDGINLYALDAETGKVVWTNGRSGDIVMPQPHPTAQARSGVSPQGYLLASDRFLFAPTGRAVPAAFDRRSGEFLYYRLQENQQRGGTRTMLGDGLLFNANVLFDMATGAALGEYSPGILASDGGSLIQATGDLVSPLGWEDREKTDRKGNVIRYRALVPRPGVRLSSPARELVLAHGEPVCGQDGAVSIVDLHSGKVRWSHGVEGAALGLAVADARLVVSTDQGAIYCFGPQAARPSEKNGVGIAHREPSQSLEQSVGDARPSDSIDYAAAAKEILEKTNIREGFCVDLGGGEGRLAEELARQSGLTVYVVESDAAKVAAARRRLEREGLYPRRIAIHAAEPAEPGYPQYLANLIVSARSLSAGSPPAPDLVVNRIQRPWGGAACFGLPGRMTTRVRGPLEGAGPWTHQNADPGNTICSTDRLVKGPLSMLWYRDVDFELTNRHGQGPAPLARDGYLIVEGVDGVCAIDAYNGRTIWTCGIEGVLKDYDGIHHDVAIGDTGSNICLGEDSVYVATGTRCLRLDLATGRKRAEYLTPAAAGARHRAWGYLAYAKGILYGSIANSEHTISPRYRDISLRNESVLLFALDPRTGRKLWQYEPAGSLRHNAIAVAAGRLFFIDRPLALADRITELPADGRHRPLLKPGDQPGGTLVALDAATGRVLWRQSDDIFGTQLGASEAQGVVLMNYLAVKHNFFKLPSEVGGRLAAFDAADGQRLWDRPATYKTRPILNGQVIYAEGGAWDLATGRDVPFDFKRSYGCGQICSSPSMMLFRSGTLGYLDLARKVGVENFGGMRTGCWFNAIPANGLVLAPDGSSKCVCSYQMQAWIALQPAESQ